MILIGIAYALDDPEQVQLHNRLLRVELLRRSREEIRVRQRRRDGRTDP
jgi:hypothetical protein